MENNSFEFYLDEYLERASELCGGDKTEKRHYQQMSKEYDDRDFLNHLENILGISVQGKRFLEIGSGSGWRSVILALGEAEAYGIEPVAAGVKAATLRAGRYSPLKCEFKEGVAENIPYPDNFFDVAISFQVIEHVQSIEKSLTEMYRVLKPGGVVYIETGNSLWPREEHYRIFWVPYTPKFIGKIYARLLGKNPSHLDHVHFIYRNDVLNKMEKAGFKEIEDKFKQYMSYKLTNPDFVKNCAFRKITKVFRVIGMNWLLTFLIVKIGFYPSLWLFGRKLSKKDNTW